MIHSFKYNRRRHLCQPLSLLAIEGIGGFFNDRKVDFILPVPLHNSRLRQRGFNQAVLLGSKVSRALDIPMLPDVLVRNRKTEPQVELSASERRLNVKDAFSVKKHQMLAGKRIILLDDVITTGSTMNECAKELKKAGAEIVIAVTIARTAR
jgi:ComF family protein